MKTVLPLFVPGLLFGAGLAVSGMTNPAKVQGFLDVTGRWDPSLALVMAGAMLVFAVGSRIVERGSRPLLCGAFPPPPPKSIDARLVVGSALFGIGWGLAGFCPGPAVTDAAMLRPEVFVFLGAMVVGMRVAQVGFGADRPMPAPAATAGTKP